MPMALARRASFMLVVLGLANWLLDTDWIRLSRLGGHALVKLAGDFAGMINDELGSRSQR